MPLTGVIEYVFAFCCFIANFRYRTGLVNMVSHSHSLNTHVARSTTKQSVAMSPRPSSKQMGRSAVQLWTDNNLPPVDLWGRAVNRGHSGATLRPLLAKRSTRLNTAEYAANCIRSLRRCVGNISWFHVVCTGVIYPEFRGRTPPPTYSASMMDYEDRPRTVSCEDVEMFPNTSTSVDVEPVPATPPPAYRGHCGRSSARRSMPVYCPRALRSRPVSFVANDSTRPATSGSASAVVARANSSSEFDVGKWLPGIERGMVPTGSLKPEASDSQAVSISYPDDDRCLATSSSHETHES